MKEFLIYSPPAIAIENGRLVAEKGDWKPRITDGALHRNFAELDFDDLNQIAQFASEFGFLNSGTTESEPLKIWREQIFEAKAFSQLIEASPKKLKELVAPTMRNDRYTVQLPFDKTKHWEGITKKTKLKTERERVNWVLFGRVEQAFRKYPVSLVPNWDGSNQALELRPNPTLVQIIWMQLAELMSANAKKLVRCEVCEKWIPARRTTRRTCSDACKQTLYRRKNTSHKKDELTVTQAK